jgi:hypothetical protein
MMEKGRMNANLTRTTDHECQTRTRKEPRSLVSHDRLVIVVSKTGGQSSAMHAYTPNGACIENDDCYDELFIIDDGQMARRLDGGKPPREISN